MGELGRIGSLGFGHTLQGIIAHCSLRCVLSSLCNTLSATRKGQDQGKKQCVLTVFSEFLRVYEEKKTSSLPRTLMWFAVSELFRLMLATGQVSGPSSSFCPIQTHPVDHLVSIQEQIGDNLEGVGHLLEPPACQRTSSPWQRQWPGAAL